MVGDPTATAGDVMIVNQRINNPLRAAMELEEEHSEAFFANPANQVEAVEEKVRSEGCCVLDDEDWKGIV